MLYDNSEKQKELFDEFKSETKGLKLFKGKGHMQQGRAFLFQVSFEKIVFFLIGAVIIIAIAFCLGVERGKYVAGIPRPVAPASAPIKQLIPVALKPQPATNVTTKVPASLRKSVIYTIRIASYTNKKSAAGETAKLRQTGFPAYVKASGSFYMICVGDYLDKNQADSALLALKKKYGKDIYIKTTKNN